MGKKFIISESKFKSLISLNNTQINEETEGPLDNFYEIESKIDNIVTEYYQAALHDINASLTPEEVVTLKQNGYPNLRKFIDDSFMTNFANYRG